MNEKKEEYMKARVYYGEYTLRQLWIMVQGSELSTDARGQVSDMNEG